MPPEIDARGFHESVFDILPDYYTMWKRDPPYAPHRYKRGAAISSSSGLYDGAADQGAGDLPTVKRSYRCGAVYLSSEVQL